MKKVKLEKYKKTKIGAKIFKITSMKKISCVGSRAEGGVASKLRDSTRLMTMKGRTVLDSVKMLACMFGGMYNWVAMEY